MRTWFAGDFVHELAHQEDSSTANSNLAGIEVGNGGQVESGSFILQANLDSIRQEPALNVERRRGAVAVCVPDDIAGGFIDGQDDRVGDGRIEPAGLTHGLHKQSGGMVKAKGNASVILSLVVVEEGRRVREVPFRAQD